jgi:hypothetical protein
VFGKQGEPARLPGGDRDGPSANQQHAEAPDSAYVQKIAMLHTPTSATTAPKQPVTNVVLPKTATDARLVLWLGFLMLLANIPLILYARWQARRGAE